MKILKRTAALLLSLILLVCLCGCTTYDNFYNAFFTEKVEEETVKFGVMEPLSGEDKDAAALEIEGIEIAHELYPEVLGLGIDLIYEDNQSDVTIAEISPDNFYEKGCSVILGSYKNTYSLSASKAVKSLRIPAVGITCQNPLITSTNEFYFRVCYINAYEGIGAARYAFEKLGAKRAAVFQAQNNDYSASMTDAFTLEFQALFEEKYPDGVNVGSEENPMIVTADDCVKQISYPSDAIDFSAYYKQIAESKAYTIFFPSSAKLADWVIKNAVEAGHRFNWIGTSTWDGIDSVSGSLVDSAGTYLNGVSYIVDFDASAQSTSMAEQFKKAYAQKYGEDAVPSDAAALGFDAYMVARAAVEVAGDYKNTELIAKKLAATKDFEGTTGYLTFDENGDPLKEVIIERFVDGSVNAVYTVTPGSGEGE